MEKKYLLEIADGIRAKAAEYKASLESYFTEIKKSGRDVTKEDTKNMQDLKVKLLTQLRRHTKIYRLIYGME